MKDKKDIIIEAAAELLIKENYQTMKTADLANIAGVAEGTLYRYFKNKREIFTTVIGYLGNNLIENFFIGIDEKNSLMDNIRIVRLNLKKISKENRHKTIIYGKAFSEIDNEEVKDILRETIDRGIKIIKEMFLWAKEKGELDNSLEELEIVAISFWGIAEFYMKRSIVGFEVKDSEIESIIGILFKVLKK